MVIKVDLRSWWWSSEHTARKTFMYCSFFLQFANYSFNLLLYLMRAIYYLFIFSCFLLFRVCIPFLKMLDQMLANNCFEMFTTQEKWVQHRIELWCYRFLEATSTELKFFSLCTLSHQFCVDLLDLCREVRKSKDVSKLRSCIAVWVFISSINTHYMLDPAGRVAVCVDCAVCCVPVSVGWSNSRVTWGRRFSSSCWSCSATPSLWWEYSSILDRCTTLPRVWQMSLWENNQSVTCYN